MLSTPRVSARSTEAPDSTVTIALSVDNPFPFAGTAAVANPEPVDAPSMDRAAVSPVAPLTQSFCRISDVAVRALVIVHVTSTGSAGTW